MKKVAVFRYIFAALFLLSPLTVLRGNSITDLHGVEVKNAKIPFYNRNVLQAMIFADKAEYRANLLYGTNVVIDMLRKNVDPDRISNDWKLQLYPLDAGLKNVALFWKKRINFCDAVIASPEGTLDQRERTAAGDREIWMRSPMLDLDGVGFAADFKRHQIRVNSEVQFVLRTQKSDPRLFKNGIPAKYEFIRGRSDMLHLDSARNRILLLGKVEVADENVKLTCDRLTLITGAGKKSGNAARLGPSGISEIYADGNVKVEKRLAPGASKDEVRELHGEHLVYHVASEQLRVSGDKTPPFIVSGTGFMLRGKELVFFRAKNQLIVTADCWMRLTQNGTSRFLRSDYGNFNFTTGICDFLGNVRGSAPQHELVCSKMRVFLRRSGKKSAPAKNANSSPLSGVGAADTGSMEFERALCRGNVFMLRKEAKGFTSLNSDDGDINYLTGNGIFTGRVKVKSDGNTLDTAKLHLKFRKVAGNSGKMELLNAEAAPGVKVSGTPDANGEMAVLTARRGFFDYAANRIDFIDDVKSRRGKSSLTAERLELFLISGSGGKSAAVPGVPGGSNRTLKNAVASGNAVMNDGENQLRSDRIEYFFAPVIANAKAEPGMFQSGSLQLTRVVCDGSVVINNKISEPVAGSAKTAPNRRQKSGAGVMLGKESEFREIRSKHLVSDFNANTTVFTENVSMTDGSSRMDCEKLEFFTRKSTPALPVSGPAPADIDDDPFDLPAENSVPRVIAIGKGLELDRAIASNNVVIDRRDPDGKANAKVFCEQAFFRSQAMTVECTGTPEQRPKAESSGKTHEADKFILHLKDERIESIGEGIIK